MKHSLAALVVGLILAILVSAPAASRGLGEGGPEGWTREEKCLTVQDSLPEDLDVKGHLVYTDRYGVNSRYFDFKDRKAHLFPLPDNSILGWDGSSDYAVSPDGKRLAFIVSGYEKQVFHKVYRFYRSGRWVVFPYEQIVDRQKTRELRLINSNGRMYSPDWPVDWQYIGGWVDNQRIMLTLPHKPFGSTTVLNLFTGAVEEIVSPSPDSRPGYYFSYSDVKYNSQLNRVTIPIIGDKYDYSAEITIQDLKTGKQVWSRKVDAFDNYQWSPDGSFLAIRESTGQFTIYDKDGQTVLPSTFPANVYGWSPDSQFIVIGANYSNSEYYSRASLSLIDLNRRQIVDYCIQLEGNYSGHPFVWSLDSRWIAWSSFMQEEGSSGYYRYSYYYKTVLIDTQNNIAYQLPKGMRVLAWMDGE